MRWEELFDRAEPYDVTEPDVTAALTEHREGDAGGDGEREDGA